MSHDVTLDWIDGDPNHEYWWGRYAFRARHRDGLGWYYISRTEARDEEYIRFDGTLKNFTLENFTFDVRKVPEQWSVEYVPSGGPPGWASLHVDDDLDEVKSFAVEHHRRSRREHAWACYMRDNDPPVVAP